MACAIGAAFIAISGCEQKQTQAPAEKQAQVAPEKKAPAPVEQPAPAAEPAKAPAAGEAPAQSTTRSLGTAIDDSGIAMRIKSAFVADPEVKSLDITVEARKGEVQLSGFVDSQAQIDRAVD